MTDCSVRFQAVPADPSPYLTSVDALEAATAELPPGWLRAYAAMVRHLRQMATPSRHALTLAAPEIEFGHLTIAQSRVDRCVSGTLRKGETRLLSTCVRCSAPARLRLDNFDLLPQCAKCWSIKVLHRELSRLLADLYQAPTVDTTRLYTSDDLPTLAGCAIPDAAWTMLAVGAERTQVRCVSREALVAMAGNLTALRDAMAERLSAAQ